jgi:hypothetical protein
MVCCNPCNGPLFFVFVSASSLRYSLFLYYCGNTSSLPEYGFHDDEGRQLSHQQPVLNNNNKDQVLSCAFYAS